MNIGPLAGLLRKSTRPVSGRPNELLAVNDLFLVQRGTTKKLWPVENDVAFIGAKVSSVGPLSPNQGSISIDVPQRSRLNYNANPTFTGTVACPYTIDDEFGSSQGTMYIFCSSAAPLPLGQNNSLSVYSGSRRWRRVLKNCSGNGLTVTSVSAPPVGSAYIVDTQVSSSVTEQAVEIYAPPGVVASYSLTVTLQDSLARQATAQLAVKVEPKPNVSWPSGIGHFTTAERSGYEIFMGRKPTAGSHWVGHASRACSTCPYYSQTMESLAGGPYDQLTTFDHFFTRPKAQGFYDSLRNPPDRRMTRNWVYPLLPYDWSNRSNQRPQIWLDVSTTSGETAGVRHEEWKRAWYAFGYRSAAMCGSIGLDPADITLDLGWEMTGNMNWRIGPDLTSFQAAWRLMVDKIREGAAAYRSDLAGFKFTMRPARNAEDGHPLAAIYPGPEYVDVISLSMHDGESDMASEEGWSKFLFGGSGKYGLMDVLALSIATGKPMGFGEWDVYHLYRLPSDVVDRHSFEGQEWLERWFRWLHTLRQRVAYEAYLHEQNWLFDGVGAVRPLPYAQQYQALWRDR